MVQDLLRHMFANRWQVVHFKRVCQLRSDGPDASFSHVSLHPFSECLNERVASKNHELSDFRTSSSHTLSKVLFRFFLLASGIVRDVT